MKRQKEAWLQQGMFFRKDHTQPINCLIFRERKKYSPDSTRRSSGVSTQNMSGPEECPRVQPDRKRLKQRGSMTVEAAMVLPLFLFAIISLLSVLQMLQTFMETEMKLYTTARTAAVYTAAVKEGTDASQDVQDDWIRLKLVYPVSGKAAGPFRKTLLLENHVNVHIFNGYSGSDGKERTDKKEEYVYITEQGQVYHRRRDCSHLKVTVRSVSAAGASSERNSEGGKYYRCPYCCRGLSQKDLRTKQLFVTDYGDRYHVRLNCSRLKRTVRCVPISQVGGRRPCSLCG